MFTRNSYDITPRNICQKSLHLSYWHQMTSAFKKIREGKKNHWMKFGCIFPTSPECLNQCGFCFFLSPETSAAARDCCMSSVTSPSEGLYNLAKQIRRLVPPCGNITVFSQTNVRLMQPSKAMLLTDVWVKDKQTNLKITLMEQI